MIAAAPASALTIRPAYPEDQAFVAATMSEQLQRGRCTDANATVDRVLDSDSVRVLIALDGGRIVGWLAYAAIPRVRAVLFVYVRRSSRLQGVARALVDEAWPSRKGQWVHGGLTGTSTKTLLQRHSVVEMPLSDLL